MTIYNVSHSFCDDGLASAWVIKQAFPKIETQFSLPNVHEWRDLDIKAGDLLYFTDFSPLPQHAIEFIINKGADFAVYDHHLTAQEKLNSCPDKSSIEDKFHFDMAWCGAVVTWKKLFPDKELPELLKYIDIADLWKWDTDPDADDICAYIRFKLRSNDIESFDILAKNFDKNVAKEKGKLLKEHCKQQIDRILNHKYILNFDGTEIAATNDSTFPSELGHLLSEVSPSKIGIAFYMLPLENMVKVSVRGTGAKAFAERFGGGGHELASAFTINLDRFVEYLKTAKKIDK